MREPANLSRLVLAPRADAVSPLKTAAAPDADLLRLGVLFEAAWQDEVTAWAAYQRAQRSDVLARRWNAANDVTSGIVEQIETLPATTFAGLIVKTRACSWTHSGEPFDDEFFGCHGSTDYRLATSVLNDLMAIDGRPLPQGTRAPDVAISVGGAAPC